VTRHGGENVAIAHTTTEQNKSIVREFLDVFSTGDVPRILERLHDDATWAVLGKVEGFAGTRSKAEMGTLLEGVVTMYKAGALRLTPRELTAEGDRVVVEAEGYGELTNGRVYNPQYVLVFEIADGKVKRVREYLDTQHAFDIFFAQ
jgi:ketosteroid isomerase-like protein